jgi:sugar/nucleoside kinase (ribokinase family)
MDRTIGALMLGGIAWNTMVCVDTFPEPRPQTVFAKGSHTTVGSSGAGKALNMRYLGAEVTLWGLLGDDDAGQAARAYVANRGVNLLTDTDPLGTMRHINLMNDAGERISIFANTASHDFDVDVDAIEPIAQDADIVSVTIMDYCRAFLPMLRRLGKPISVDIHDYDGVDPYHTEFIDAADYLFMSSLAMPDWRSFLETRIAAGVTAAICTHGSAGASGITQMEGWVDVPAAPVETVTDTNGAGDGFYSGFMTAWLGGLGLKASLDRGAEIAAVVVQSPGLAPT